MGTPEFAVPSLRAVCKSGCRVLAVVTQPDRPSGRGKSLKPSPVKVAAQELDCPLLQPESIRTEAFREAIQALEPDFLVVVAFGQILPPALLRVPRFGAVNVHPSLLPKYRGPAPIQWAILNGERETGVTVIRMDAGMDTGDRVLCSPVAIRPGETTVTLHDRLAREGARVLVSALEGLRSGALKGVPQDHSQATYAPLLKKQDGRIDWTRTARELDCFVRGMNPWPGAFTFLGGRRLVIHRARRCPAPPGRLPGSVLPGPAHALVVAAGEQALELLEVQPASGKRLEAAAFLRGNPVSPGVVLG